MKFITPPICDITGTPFPLNIDNDNQNSALSLEAQHTPPHYDKARIAVKFDNNSRNLIHKLKYQDQHHLASQMAKMMVNAAGNLLDKPEDNMICPVPLYHWRYFKRRANQADLLANHIAKISNATYVPRLIKRKTATKTQVGLTRKQRIKNVKNAFIVDKKLLKFAKGKNIFIVDDVVTTGATVNEVALCLKASGLGPIYILAFAKVIQNKVI